MPHNAEGGPDPRNCSRAGGTKVTDWRPTVDRFERSSWRQSVPPEVFEPRLTQCRVARGVGDRHMTEPILDRAGIDAVVGQLVAAAMAQHVEVDGKWNAGPLADDLDQPVDGVRRERRATLRGEDVAAVWIFLPQCRQHTQFIAADRVDGGLALLGAADMQGSRAAELDLAPFQFAGLFRAQAVPVGHDDEAGVALPPAAVLGRLDQPLDLGPGQIFPAAQIGIGLPRRHGPRTDEGTVVIGRGGNNLGRVNLPVFVTWLDQFQARDHWQIPRFPRSTHRITRLIP